MEARRCGSVSKFCGSICDSFRHCLFRVLSFGPIPQHIAFIMDGNRRFARFRNLEPGKGHQAGVLALTSVLQYCYELGVKYVTIYAFSIDNFKRKPEEVQQFMDLMLGKIEELLNEGSIVNQFGIKVNFFGNLGLLSSLVRKAIEKVMKATAGNTKAVLSICVAYTCTDEIVHAVEQSCRDKLSQNEDKSQVGLVGNNSVTCDLGESAICLADLERHMYTAGCPDPDILVRTSGETRLSNFLLWQTTFCVLLAPNVLWPEISLRHLVSAILEYQRLQPYLEERKKLMVTRR